MYTVAVKSCEDTADDYIRYGVDKDVYYYIRSLESSVMHASAKDRLRLRYPKRFPNKGGNNESDN